MKVIECFNGRRPVFSFEFFLPKTPEGMANFIETVRGLKRLGPSFVTLTYGAGGSSRDRTIETAGMIQNELGLTTVAHLTGIAHTRSEIEEILKRLRGYGIENLMLLRGDPPKDRPVPPLERRDYRYAVDLVRHARAFGGFCIGVAGYPERHVEAAGFEEDLVHLKEKAEAGADFITTQLFFENEPFFRFVERARAMGIRQPILPGLMPVTNYGQLRRFAAMCGASIPERLAKDLEAHQTDAEYVVRYGIEWTYQQARELLNKGASGIHFYTLNQSRSTEVILSRLLGGRTNGW
jgi:methylenetetrahydrofolate reductase (NADPH)